MRASVWMLVVAAGLTAAGCRGREHAQTSDSPSTAASAPGDRSSSDDRDSADERATRKLNSYVKGYNGLIGTFGLNDSFQQYLGQQIARKGVNDPVFLNAGWVKNSLDDLQKARAIPGGPRELDAAADPLIATLNQLNTRVQGLAIYYQTRGQLQDNFARGKREDPLVIAGYRQGLGQLQPLSDAIDREQDRRDQAVLDARKADGDLVGYDAALALQKAKALMRLFHSDADLKNPALYARGDALVNQMQAALDDERVQKAKADQGHDTDHGLSDSMNASAAEALENLIGRYRDLKQAGTPMSYQMMIYAYNQAIRENNYGQIGQAGSPPALRPGPQGMALPPGLV